MILNVDAGELVDEPVELAAGAHLLHVACGGHAGDEGTMRETLRRAKRFGTRIGAHPSYPDREGFGRRPIAMARADLEASLRAQVHALDAIAHEEGMRLETLKAHGALYHAANRDPALASLLVAAATTSARRALAVVGPPEGRLREAALAEGVVFLREGFADRAYDADGTLRDRGKPGALIDDPAEALAQAIALAPRVDTVCVHGDGANALAILASLRRAFP